MDVATINVDISGDGALATVAVAGSVTIVNSNDLRLAFMDVLDRAPQVSLDIRKLEEVDITAAQVICSACKTAAVLERSFVTVGKLPECLINLGKTIGAPQGVPCPQNHNEPCSWFGGAYE